MSSILDFRAGPVALARIRDEGLPQSSIEVVPGASGGPKWFVLTGLDKALLGEYFKDRQQPLHLLGTSAGSWRFACYAHPDPLAAHERFEQGYLLTEYSESPTPEEITTKCRHLIREIIGSQAGSILNNDIMRYNLIAVRSRGLGKSHRKGKLMAGMGMAALANVVSRKTLGLFFTRTLFYPPGRGSPFHQMNDLPTDRVELSEANLADAILASGSIPMVMEGVEGIAGAPEGIYRDGGVTDYHFDTRFAENDKLVLYPHFYGHRTPGWFDKGIKWRKPSALNSENVVVVSPSDEFVAKLPYGKIPDRNDFVNLSYKERVRYWSVVIQESQRLGDEFLEQVNSGRIRETVQPL
ncbi:patatin-like phospholipase family protein [Endozoicomonas lisbonensis]|uniref:PNPLA domain-containing protein n=1 Tax=Endozoicomonas lisbonensis TaxID=3120522 RepID=A0ABV2SHW5_9GAMM